MQKILQKVPATKASYRAQPDVLLRSSPLGSRAGKRLGAGKSGQRRTNTVQIQSKRSSKLVSDETTLSLRSMSTLSKDKIEQRIEVDFTKLNEVLEGVQREKAHHDERGPRNSFRKRVSIKSSEEEEAEAEEEYDTEENYIVMMSTKEVHAQELFSERRQEDEDDDFEDIFSNGSSVQDLEVVQDLIEDPNFFDELSEIPDIADISSVEEEPEAVEVVKFQYDKLGGKKDMGNFVDAFTGEPLESFSQLHIALSQAPIRDEIVEEAIVEEESLSFDARFDYVQEEEKPEIDLKSMIESVHSDETFQLPESVEDEEEEVKVDHDVTQLLLEIEAPRIKLLDEAVDDEEARAVEEARLMLETQTQDFLHSLITRIVNICEYLSPAKLLRLNMDKKKVVEELENILGQIDIEQMVRLFLNRKCVEYYRRKKTYRAIMEDNPDTVNQDMDKFSQATQNLDLLLGREQDMLNVTGPKVIELGREVREMENKAELSVYEFDRLAKDLVRYNDRTPRFQKMVSNSLGHISHYRDEISTKRLLLIQRLHTSARLAERLNAVDNIGNELRMSNYETLNTETNNLGKKIEAFDDDLKRLHVRCDSDRHIVGHVREKQDMLRATVAEQKRVLAQLYDDKRTLRELVNVSKGRRAKVRREIRDLSGRGGLLDKPILMLDYDDTLDRLIVLRERVRNMRERHNNLQWKFDKTQQKDRRSSQTDIALDEYEISLFNTNDYYISISHYETT